MKRFLLALLVMTGPLMAQKSGPALVDAVRAYNGGDLETASSMFEAILAADPKNNAAQTYMRMIKAQQKAGDSLTASLKKIKLEKVDFQDASAKEAFEFLSQQVQKKSGGKQGINIVWMVPEGQEKRITLSLQDVPAFEALKYVAEASNLQLEYDNFAVKVKPAGASVPAQ